VANLYSKAQLTEIASQLGTAYHEGEKEILRRIQAAELTVWQQARAQQQLLLIRDALDEMGEATVEWGQIHLPGLYQAGMDVANDVFKKAPPEELAALHTESIKLVGENLAVRMDDGLSVVGRQVDDVFRQAALNSLQQATILGETRRQATKQMVQELLDQGVTAFVDKRGTQWSLGRYSEMVARTTSREAQTQGTVNRQAELGEDLVEISSHGGACPLCEPWEGQILSISGNSDKYDSLGNAEAAGLFHPNCLHVAMPYSERYAGAA